MFFDPLLVALDPPADLRAGVVDGARSSAAADPTLTAAIHGADRTLMLAAFAAVALAFGLVLTARAVRASARLTELRSEFVATVTHELKTPIATIRAAGDTLAVRPHQRRRASSASTRGLVVQEAKRLTRLVDNLLAMSRITDVTEVYSFEPLALDALAEHAVRSSPAADGRGFDVEIDIPRGSAAGARRSHGDEAAARQPDRQRDPLLAGDAVAADFGAPERQTAWSCWRSPISGSGIPSDEIDHVTRKFVRGRHAGPAAAASAWRSSSGSSPTMAGAWRSAARSTPARPSASAFRYSKTMMKKRILVVEDDAALARVLRDNLTFDGFEVQWVADGNAALQTVREFAPGSRRARPDAAGHDGFELCGLLRQGGRTPIIMLTARGQKADKLRGLNLGADDYVTKPFDLEELLARVHAVLRRTRPAVEQLTLGARRHRFPRPASRASDGRTIHLTHREFELLAYLAERQERVVHRDELLREVWGYPDAPSTRSVDHAIARLRKKIEPDPHHPRFIHTVHGDGYCLTPAGAPEPMPDAIS